MKLIAPALLSLVILTPLLAQQPAAAPSPANDEAAALLTRLITENRYPLTLDGQNLRGAGADFLIRATNNAQFVALGEEHNVAEIPRFTTALFRLLHDRHGFNYFADEQDAWMLRSVARAPYRGDLAAIRTLQAKYPQAFTFRGDEELQMLADLARISTGKADRLWGLDQVFGAYHILEALLPFAPNDDVRNRTRALIALAKENENKPFDPDAKRFLVYTEKPADYWNLAALYDAKPGSEAEWLIRQLHVSTRAYENWRRAAEENQPTGYESNREREENMKWIFAQNYHAASKADGHVPKAILKMGHWHLYRGIGPGGVLTTGNFITEVATLNGMKSFHIAIMLDDGSGSAHDLVKSTPWMQPMVAASYPDSWTLIDIRPLRAYSHAARLGTLDNTFRRMILGFDAVLLIRGGHGATYTSASVIKGAAHESP